MRRRPMATQQSWSGSHSMAWNLMQPTTQALRRSILQPRPALRTSLKNLFSVAQMLLRWPKGAPHRFTVLLQLAEQRLSRGFSSSAPIPMRRNRMENRLSI
mmetsp:Transcript_56071/g.146888  ORF Transcript_56071/g.146888 Transcript_56071/m.146888 type:complete len:101 (+) Transcript_56071:133-435(+)